MSNTRKPTHPGAILREDVFPALDNMSISEAAKRMKVSRQMLHKILAEKAPITPDMAVRIGKFCGNGPAIWLRMQQAVDRWEAERALAPVVKQIETAKVKEAA